jgi:hypothetical protein
LSTGEGVDPVNGTKSALLQRGLWIADTLVESFNIIDWGLFVDEEGAGAGTAAA